MRLITGGEINGKRFRISFEGQYLFLDVPDDMTEGEMEVVMARVQQAIEKANQLTGENIHIAPDFKA